MASSLKTWSVVLTLLATVALGGCSFPSAQPPAAVDAAVDAALATFRNTEGVREASGYASLIDSAWGGEALKDPDSWIARFTITADPHITDLATLTDDVDEALWTARATVISVASLQLPADSAAPEAVLEFSLPPAAVPVVDMVAAVTLLRQIGNIERVYVSTYPSPARATATAPVQWAETAAALRALTGFGTGGLRAITISSPAADNTGEVSSVTLDAVSPALPLIAAFGEIVNTAGVESASLIGVRAFDLVDESGSWRPTISLSTDTGSQAERLAQTLSTLPDSETTVVGVPRAGFSTSDYETTFTGFVGLPIGASVPDDGVPTAPTPSTLSTVDPQIAASRLEDGRVLVESLLAEAGELAGIHGITVLEAVGCAEDRGSQIRGSVVVPIFEIAETADDAFDRITKVWTDRGFEPIDRAMGTDIYEAAGLDSLTIRGTSDGIRIIATANCSA